MPQWGYIADTAGASIELKVDTTSIGREGATHTPIVLNHLKSYEHMGKAGARTVAREPAGNSHDCWPAVFCGPSRALRDWAPCAVSLSSWFTQRWRHGRVDRCLLCLRGPGSAYIASKSTQETASHHHDAPFDPLLEPHAGIRSICFPLKQCDAIVTNKCGSCRDWYIPRCAAVACVRGCECEASTLDGHWEVQASQGNGHYITVTPHPECVLRVTVLEETASGERKVCRQHRMQSSGRGRSLIICSTCSWTLG